MREEKRTWGTARPSHKGPQIICNEATTDKTILEIRHELKRGSREIYQVLKSGINQSIFLEDILIDKVVFSFIQPPSCNWHRTIQQHV
jgi:hypothetical protein